LIEYVGGYLKENVTNNYFFGELDRLIEAVKQACRELNSAPDAMLRINFRTVTHLYEAA